MLQGEALMELMTRKVILKLAPLPFRAPGEMAAEMHEINSEVVSVMWETMSLLPKPGVVV